MKKYKVKRLALPDMKTHYETTISKQCDAGTKIGKTTSGIESIGKERPSYIQPLIFGKECTAEGGEEVTVFPLNCARAMVHPYEKNYTQPQLTTGLKLNSKKILDQNVKREQ